MDFGFDGRVGDFQTFQNIIIATLLMETVLLEEKKLQYSHIDSIENNDSIFVLVA
jgi:hypothetical protein